MGALKRSQGLSHAQAQAAYRILRDKLDKPVKTADLRQHPRITTAAAKKAPAAAAKYARERKAEKAALIRDANAIRRQLGLAPVSRERKVGREETGFAGGAPATHAVNSLAQFWEEWDDTGEWEEWESTAEYTQGPTR